MNHKISHFSIIKNAYALILFNYAINDNTIGISARDLEKKFQGYTHLSDITTGFQKLVDNDLIKPLRKSSNCISHS
jgi:hypothetical protein